ncbi:hypothetical protein BDV12DRAFT_197377 [Aspergillus spectabilis]
MRQEAARTADPGQHRQSNTGESYVHNYAKFPHSIHEFAKRTPKTEHKPHVPGRSSNSTKTHHVANKTSKALIQKWTYEKASIAASSIFGAVAVGAIIFLIIVLVKKFRRRRRRKKEGNRDSLDEKRRQRENMMFSKSHSAREYLVEQKDGRVIRVQCTSNRHRDSLLPECWPGRNLVGIPKQSISSITRNPQADTAPHLEPLNSSDSGRSGSIPKRIVIVTPPLQPVTSRKAVPDSYLAEASEKLELTTSSALEPLDSYEETELDVTPTPSFRLSMFRLPSIRQSFSPLFPF